LSVDELREAARSEDRGKVRARLLATAHLLEGGERGVTKRGVVTAPMGNRCWTAPEFAAICLSVWPVAIRSAYERRDLRFADDRFCRHQRASN